ncbi:hypothetical protein ULMS_14810 [Patiriisocius marinistellae]|uniref:Uncharacterized protein n=1 Tax=Patiriisocius marinistellae TaxID=2494560 RepID=A0A5J4FVM7_9FLAO|nr:hypothetical protein [Patiriisocius marinistellae]GEQ85973.1 hypothetical protein ULMS_14810 [Patiriisocius marinistellae]
MSSNKTIVRILEIISTALSLTWLFVSTIGILLLGIYIIFYSMTEDFEKPYQEGMYFGTGVVTLIVSIILIGTQVYFIRQTKLKIKNHEEQANKEANQN